MSEDYVPSDESPGDELEEGEEEEPLCESDLEVMRKSRGPPAEMTIAISGVGVGDSQQMGIGGSIIGRPSTPHIISAAC